MLNHVATLFIKPVLRKLISLVIYSGVVKAINTKFYDKKSPRYAGANIHR